MTTMESQKSQISDNQDSDITSNEEEEQDCGEYEIWEMLQMKNAGRKDYHVEKL